MSSVPCFDVYKLEGLCEVIGETATGLTGSEIGYLLQHEDIEDPTPGIRKSRRLFNALSQRQDQDRCGNAVLMFVRAVLEPIRWRDKPDDYRRMHEEINRALSFAGYSIGQDGSIRSIPRVRTLTQAEERAGKLRTELLKRSVHPDVLRFCRPELLHDNYFHAVLEATKSVAEKIRQKTGLAEDAADLVDRAFGLNKGPMLAFNALRTESERSEHTGIMNLMKGMFGAFRNVTAHAPRVHWTVQEQDAMDLLAIASFLHRRLDAAASVQQGSQQT